MFKLLCFVQIFEMYTHYKLLISSFTFNKTVDNITEICNCIWRISSLLGSLYYWFVYDSYAKLYVDSLVANIFNEAFRNYENRTSTIKAILYEWKSSWKAACKSTREMRAMRSDKTGQFRLSNSTESYPICLIKLLYICNGDPNIFNDKIDRINKTI